MSEIWEVKSVQGERQFSTMDDALDYAETLNCEWEWWHNGKRTLIATVEGGQSIVDMFRKHSPFSEHKDGVASMGYWQEKKAKLEALKKSRQD
jgi:hypothetical protein